jgi:hypothetical protein
LYIIYLLEPFFIEFYQFKDFYFLLFVISFLLSVISQNQKFILFIFLVSLNFFFKKIILDHSIFFYVYFFSNLFNSYWISFYILDKYIKRILIYKFFFFFFYFAGFYFNISFKIPSRLTLKTLNFKIFAPYFKKKFFVYNLIKKNNIIFLSKN